MRKRTRLSMCFSPKPDDGNRSNLPWKIKVRATMTIVRRGKEIAQTKRNVTSNPVVAKTLARTNQQVPPVQLWCKTRLKKKSAKLFRTNPSQ
jgi:hypothetical protein